MQKWFRCPDNPDQMLTPGGKGVFALLSRRQKCRGENVLLTKKLLDEKSVFQYHMADSVGPLVGKNKSLN